MPRTASSTRSQLPVFFQVLWRCVWLWEGLRLLCTAAWLEKPRVNHDFPKTTFVNNATAHLLSFPVCEVDERKAWSRGMSALGFDIWTLIRVVAVAGRLWGRGTGCCAVSIGVLPFQLVEFLELAFHRFAVAAFHLFGFCEFEAWARSRIHYMVPVLFRLKGQFFPPLYQQDTGIADISSPVLQQPKTESEGFLISSAVCESRAGRLRLADAAAFVAAIDLRFMKTKHLSCW